MKPVYQILFQVKSDLINLPYVLSKFETIKQPWIANKDWLKCQLALAEGFTNTVRHAHCCHPSETLIDIDIKINFEQIVIKIWDYGKPWNLLEQILLEQKKEEEETLVVGGKGILLMYAIADELRYDCMKDDRNCLMIKKIIIPKKKDY